MWDPDQYQRFAGQRARPFFELLARVGATDPRLVADLGCGPGELTAALAGRWPGADVVGVDSSPEMIRAAGALPAAALLAADGAEGRQAPAGRLSFVKKPQTTLSTPYYANTSLFARACKRFVPDAFASSPFRAGSWGNLIHGAASESRQ